MGRVVRAGATDRRWWCRRRAAPCREEKGTRVRWWREKCSWVSFRWSGWGGHAGPSARGSRGRCWSLGTLRVVEPIERQQRSGQGVESVQLGAVDRDEVGGGAHVLRLSDVSSPHLGHQ